MPGFFEHIRDYVDGFVILNDGSTDSTFDIINKESKVLKVINNPPHDIKEWSDRKNRMQLMSVAREFADVVLCCDADERFEYKFLYNLREYSKSVCLNRNKVIGLRFRELWNSSITYRNDGIWNEKTKYILFSISENSTFNKTYFQDLHIPWWHDDITEFELLDLNLYHLKMIDPMSRQKRFEMYELLDPDHRFQKIGYDYLIDEENVNIKSIEGHSYNLLSVPD